MEHRESRGKQILRAAFRVRDRFRSRRRYLSALFEAGRNCWDIGEVEETGLLIDGRDYYRAFYEAAKNAQRYILISGWEFDSDVMLLRGNDAPEAGGEVRFLSFLNKLCEANPDLEIYMLAWDFTYLYSLDREWFQSWYFNWTTNERLQFCFDCQHAFGASHHQKFVVVDGRIAFVGGLDLCSARWDERDHRPDNPKRVNSDNSPYRPFHDIQSYHAGSLAEKLAQMFKMRWKKVCGKELDLPAVSQRRRLDLRSGIPIAARDVAISRTQAKTNGDQESYQEIRQLFLDAIEAAENLIYIENQYFSSAAIYKALEERMKAADRPRLEIVMVLAKEADAFLEQVSIGILQRKVIRSLKDVAAKTGHSLGLYYPASVGKDGQEVPTYIHSKLLLVDDRFLSVGSANFNNRSMGLDTELNVSWHAASTDKDFIRSIRRVRVSLLAEHTGVKKLAAIRKLGRTKGLVNFLNELADDNSFRLRHNPLEKALDAQSGLISLFPEGLPFDSEEPFFADYSDSTGEEGFFSKGIVSLSNWLSSFQSRSESPEN